AQPCQGWGREFESRFPLQIQQVTKLRSAISENLASTWQVLGLIWVVGIGLIDELAPGEGACGALIQSIE
ncbi:MAG: hypothetical protein ACREV7_22975, partial [Steroidobacteraceae bacterium]